MEGLGEVIVGPDLEPYHAIDHVAAPGQHDDADVGAAPELARQGEPVLPGQNQVEQDHVDAR